MYVHRMSCGVPSQISSVIDTHGVWSPAETRDSPLQPLPLLHLPPPLFTAAPWASPAHWKPAPQGAVLEGLWLFIPTLEFWRISGQEVPEKRDRKI